MRLFRMNVCQARTRWVQAGAAFAAVALVAGCGNTYRPVITPVNPSGPAAQPSSLAIVVSAPSPTTPGIATLIDYSGDTVLAEAPIGPGPMAFTVDFIGGYGYTLNSDHTLTNFPISRTLQENQVTYTTLPSTAKPINMFSPYSQLWVADLDGNLSDVFAGSPQTFLLSIPVNGVTPVMVAALGSGAGIQRYFAISQNIPNSTGVECNTAPTTAPLGLVTGMEAATFTVSSQITVGRCPVYAVGSNDSRRLFVLNRGDDTISVINVQTNTLDDCTPFLNQSGQMVTCHPTLPLSLKAVNTLNTANPGSGNPPNGVAGMMPTAGPVHAEYSANTNQLVVADYDSGTISVIDVSLDEYGNDSSTFGTTFTIPVGNNPASVTALPDGTRAYAANQADQTVTIVNLSSHTVEKTLPVTGHPRTVVSTENGTQGKVYVASPDSPQLTILRTDQDIVDTTVLVEGNIVDVRVSTQTGGSSYNYNVESRLPGYGQPCDMPGAAAAATLASCQLLPLP
jgi:YVTN family beta-propeller protein